MAFSIHPAILLLIATDWNLNINDLFLAERLNESCIYFHHYIYFLYGYQHYAQNKLIHVLVLFNLFATKD